ncbi:ATP-binding protein [Streptomyces boncukensis]|uniref:ATP-binding protein n=1 Tax=Streptomyces boncukensis TaxID=2711219 RepID=A0A6G4WUY3_9ACTN|nr:ATP-binding protein [Streptomyces boncukensis]NGO68662.1 ATP-binding protein [Streptomyces boncukensis]
MAHGGICPYPLTIPALALPKTLPDVRARIRVHFTHPQLAETAALCASELVTNVIVHVGEGTPITLDLTQPGPYPRLAVTDPVACALPVLRDPDPTAEGGRGLLLLDALAHRWGVEQHADGKTVWCELGD